ncbi:hypothetical protein SAMN04488002_1138 [Litoreibacter janthinus]|uniref:Uncharacterized protein n=1 Tax=Litoreibacter janthinus TaxID=670154 RepID=A0A1I6GA97_9RHOB|nr:hypothetical protein SAMN04488002_1138 [Litoreibacter janthinus]
MKGFWQTVLSQAFFPVRKRQFSLQLIYRIAVDGERVCTPKLPFLSRLLHRGSINRCRCWPE